MAKLRECPQGRNLFSAPIDLFVGLLSLFFVKATKLLFLLMGGRVDVKAGKNTFLVLGMERARVASEIDTLFGTISRSCSEFLLRDKLGLQTETIQKLIFRKGPIFSLFLNIWSQVQLRSFFYLSQIWVYITTAAASFIAQ